MMKQSVDDDYVMRTSDAYVKIKWIVRLLSVLTGVNIAMLITQIFCAF